MNVSFNEAGRLIDIEDTTFKPASPGEFFEAILKRRNISIEEFSSLSGLSSLEIEKLIDNNLPLERPFTKKIDHALPGVSKMLVRIDEHCQFYEKYGSIKPSSSIKRALIVAKHKLELS